MNLKEVRKNVGFSQNLMAKHLGMSSSYYQKLERGERSVTEELEKKVQDLFYFKKSDDLNLEVTFDWINLHFRTLKVEQLVESLLGLKFKDFQTMEYSRYHYKSYATYGQIGLYYNDEDDAQGVLIEISGQACREFEYILSEQGRDWYDFFSDCFTYAAERGPDYFRVTRLDIALDELYGLENYDLFNLMRFMRQGYVNTPKRTYSATFGGDLTPEGVVSNGLTLYLGAKNTNLFFRFYEKDYERAKALSTTLEAVHDLYGFKNRYEIVLKQAKAHEFIVRYVSEFFDVGFEAVKIINANLTVYKDHRLSLDDAWYALMGTFETYRFTTHPVLPDLSRTRKWVERSVAPTIKSLLLLDYLDDENRTLEILSEAEESKRYQKLLESRRKELAVKKNDLPDDAAYQKKLKALFKGFS